MKFTCPSITGFNPTTFLVLALASWLCSTALAQVIESQGAPLASKTGSYYSAQKPVLPPLPFNPIAGVPVFELAPGVLVYDDRKIDYDAWRAAATL